MIKLVLGLLGSVLSSKSNLGSIYSTLIRHGETKAYEGYPFHFDLPVPYLHKIDINAKISIG